MAVTLDHLLDAVKNESPFPMVKRPGLGREGRPVSITTNLFRVDYRGLKKKLFQYDVRFTTEEKPREDLFALKKHRELRVQIYKAFVESHREAAFGNDNIPAWDGNKQLIAAAMLDRVGDPDGPERTFKVELSAAREGEENEDRDGSRLKRAKKVYLVAIKFAKELQSDMLDGLLRGNFNSVRDPREIMQALDIIMSYRLPPRYLVHGRNFYDPRNAEIAGGGSQILQGFFQSLRPATKQLFMNFDITAGLFVQSIDVIELLLQLLDARHPQDIATFQEEAIRRSLKPFLLNLKYRPRGAFKAKTITRNGADMTTFEFDGALISVATYFEKEKGIKLKYPELHCIELKHSRGAETFVEYLPLEQCKIVGGKRWAGKTTQSHVDQIRKKIASRPPQRSSKIVQSVMDTMHFGHESQGVINQHKESVLEQFGLLLDKQPMSVTARRLPLPTLHFKGNDTLKPQDGAWNMRMAKVDKAVEVRDYALFIFADRFGASEADKFVNRMASTYKQKTDKEMDTRPLILRCRDMRSREPIKEMFEEVKRRFPEDGEGVQLIFCIIDDKDSMTYHEVLQLKRLSELEYGYVTQCVKAKRARDCQASVLENIILKLNAKLGGENCTIPEVHRELIREPTLVLGGDISHGGAGSNSPSVCALVGTTDRFMQQLSASLSVQPLVRGSSEATDRLVRQEEIVGMKRMVKERVYEFIRHCQVAPLAILYYRDGVADSQFESVITNELVEIREAIRELKKDHPRWWPENVKDPVKITAIIHQKRHHIRFFPFHDCPKDKSGNCAPGLVVDSDIGHPYGYDFFLISHAGIQGVSRPSYYRVILDENDYGPDKLQQVTFYMCHLYASCTRSISGVPVCFYADRLALRVRDYLYENSGDTGSVMSGNSGRGGRGDGREHERNYETAPLHKDLVNKMFFA